MVLLVLGVWWYELEAPRGVGVFMSHSVPLYGFESDRLFRQEQPERLHFKTNLRLVFAQVETAPWSRHAAPGRGRVRLNTTQQRVKLRLWCVSWETNFLGICGPPFLPPDGMLTRMGSDRPLTGNLGEIATQPGQPAALTHLRHADMIRMKG